MVNRDDRNLFELLSSMLDREMFSLHPDPQNSKRFAIFDRKKGEHLPTLDKREDPYPYDLDDVENWWARREMANHPNRNQRRRAAKLAVVEEVELATLRGSMCAWHRCGESFIGDMPSGWVWLLAYWARQPDLALADPEAKWMRDAALCPAHARDLDLQLKEIPGSALFGPPRGEA